MQEVIGMDKNLNSINQNDSFIGYDGKTYSSIDE